MKTTLKAAMKEISKVIKDNRLIKDRETVLFHMGYTISEKAMGSGGVGQVKTLKTEIRIQIGSGHGRQNYAKCVILKP